jgi:transcription elongation factor GreA
MASSNPIKKDEQVLVTKEGFEKLKQELEYLKTIKRREVAQRLKEAIAYGDLSENSEYEEAKNEQAFVEGRIIELEKKVKNAKIISDINRGKTQEKIQIGTTVIIKNLTDNDDEETYTIVGSTEADPLNHKISNESPIGSGLIGKEKNEIVRVQVPAGVFEYKIIDLK